MDMEALRARKIAERKGTGRNVTFRVPAWDRFDTDWRTFSFATAETAEDFKRRVLLNGGEISGSGE